MGLALPWRRSAVGADAGGGGGGFGQRRVGVVGGRGAPRMGAEGEEDEVVAGGERRDGRPRAPRRPAPGGGVGGAARNGDHEEEKKNKDRRVPFLFRWGEFLGKTNEAKCHWPKSRSILSYRLSNGQARAQKGGGNMWPARLCPEPSGTRSPPDPRRSPPGTTRWVPAAGRPGGLTPCRAMPGAGPPRDRGAADGTASRETGDGRHRGWHGRGMGNNADTRVNQRCSCEARVGSHLQC